MSEDVRIGDFETEIAIIVEQNDPDSTADAASSEEKEKDMAIRAQKEKRPLEDSSSVASISSSDSDQMAQQKKAAKMEEEKGAWNCSNDMCNEEDDDFMFKCKTCPGMYHYRCTNLPLYEIARYFGPGRRVYECASCVRIPEKLKTYHMNVLEPENTYTSSLNSKTDDSGTRECNNPDLAKDITALQKDIIDKDFLIRSQKEIIEKIRNQTQASINESTENSAIAMALKEERDELLERLKTKENELVVLGKQKEKELGEHSLTIETLKKKIESKEANECSNDLVMNEATQKIVEMTDCNRDLSQRLDEKIKLVRKMESLVESKQDLVDAKNEIIDNLKVIVNTLKDENKDLKSKSLNLTSNTTSTGQNPNVEAPIEKNGVTESCEFLQVHGNNGVIMNPFLLWVNIQRKMHPEDKWKADAVKKFADTEITEAKEILWRVAGDTHLGKIVKRKGAANSTSEMNDICAAFKTLA